MTCGAFHGPYSFAFLSLQRFQPFLGVLDAAPGAFSSHSKRMVPGSDRHDRLGAAGLDYPGVGPEHSWLKDIARAEYVGVNDQEALDAFLMLSREEGIIPALESAHAVHVGYERAKGMPKDQIVVITVSGRGDKDLEMVFERTRGMA